MKNVCRTCDGHDELISVQKSALHCINLRHEYKQLKNFQTCKNQDLIEAGNLSVCNLNDILKCLQWLYDGVPFMNRDEADHVSQELYSVVEGKENLQLSDEVKYLGKT